MSAALLAGLLAGYGIAIPVGAIATYLVALTARTSLRIGACAALGVATADGAYALIAQIGGSALAHAMHPALTPFRWASAAVLIAVAVRAAAGALSRHRDHGTPAANGERTPPTPVRAYFGLWAVTMMNPLTVIYFAALVIGTQGKSSSGHAEQALFVAAAFIASASWQLLLALGGALLGRVLTGNRGRLVTALASSALIVFLAVRLAVPPR